MTSSLAKHGGPSGFRKNLQEMLAVGALLGFSAVLLMVAWDGRLAGNFGMFEDPAALTANYVQDTAPQGTIPTGDRQWDKNPSSGVGSAAQAYVDKLAPGAATVEFVASPCGLAASEGFANGCVVNYHPTTIFLSLGTVNLMDTELEALVVHELAHVYQHRLDGNFLNRNPTVARVFPHATPAEPLADCMTEQKLGFQTHNYIASCSPEQLNLAAQIWAGQLPA